jgi:hypothetical protein
MSIHRYVVRQQEGLWQVWLGDKLLSGQPTRREALTVAETLAQAAADRGEKAVILAGTMDGVTIERSVGAASGQLSAEPA